MTFWQLTINAQNPEQLSRFWAAALGYSPLPPSGPDTWQRHYRRRLGDEEAFGNRLFSPDGTAPALFFQQVPEPKAGKNRLHLDLYPTGRDDTLPQQRRIEIVDAEVARLVALGATKDHAVRDDDPDDLQYFMVMRDPEGNEFCVS